MSKTACHPLFVPFHPLGAGYKPPGQSLVERLGPAAPAATLVQYGGPSGPSTWPTRMPRSLLGMWQPHRVEINPWREDALVGTVGIYHPLPPTPTQPHSKHPAPAPVPSTLGTKQPWSRGRMQCRGGCWRGTGSPRLTVPCPCPPVAVLQVSSSPRRRRWPIGCGSLVRWPK